MLVFGMACLGARISNDADIAANATSNNFILEFGTTAIQT
jgi:hypothetical protein